MPILQQEFAATVPAVGLDVFDYAPFSQHKQASYPRKVTKITIVGSAAADDFKLDLYYGSRLIAKNLYNVVTGLGSLNSIGIPITGSDVCRPNEEISLIVTDASATNATNIKVEIT